MLQAGILLGLFLDPEGGSEIFHRNVSIPSTGYTASHPRRRNRSCSRNSGDHKTLVHLLNALMTISFSKTAMFLHDSSFLVEDSRDGGYGLF
jgi:hypothetical protein